MTAQISAYGRLVAEVKTRISHNGTHMAMGRLAVSLPCHSATDGQATFWLGVVGFGKLAEILASHEKGDLISVSGNMQVNQWTDKAGVAQTGYQVVADTVISAKAVSPKANNGAPQSSTPPNAWDIYQQPENYDQTPPFDDNFDVRGYEDNQFRGK
ncbi:single-stranded DNA-binding protein [Budvicia aquatica]|uniref:Single-stranded DNA-binding protein n=1 Tax=Budvicia aquatica TaxID=82979 RepID=A0A2C6DLC1_9GAMM|nr:single-stranded DNA-binding protein [Budvicia aquatica]PHI29493.1 single-stranded DNA-binding protein [Budvicia aquatica]VFS47792.1 Helix-destabilizing protein [Budvicia aquatica]